MAPPTDRGRTPVGAGAVTQSTEREFLPGKVYRSDDRGIVRVEFLSPHGLAFLSSTPLLDVLLIVTVPPARCGQFGACNRRYPPQSGAMLPAIDAA